MSQYNYKQLNRANWDERAPAHAASPDYRVQHFLSDPKFLSPVVRFDIPLLGPIDGLDMIHLQCHIGTDTPSLARRGANSVLGLDFSPASLKEARALCAQAEGGDKVSFVQGSVYDAQTLVGDMKGRFDLVFTGIGALCWLPDIRAWATTVAGLLKTGGRLFIREGHPVLWTVDEKVEGEIVVSPRYPYFETEKPMVFEDMTTYVRAGDGVRFEETRTVEWNHGLGEIFTALMDAGMMVTGLVEHRSVPWDALPGKMELIELDEYALKEGRGSLPLSYTLQAVKKG